MASSKPIKISILGDVSDLQSKLSKADKDLEGFGSKVSRLAGNVAKVGAALGAAGAAVGGALYAMGSQFDDAFDTIRVGTGATGKSLEGLQDDFRAVVKSVPTDFATASTAIADLNTRTGATGKNLQDLSARVLEMTRLTGGDLPTNIAAVTRVFGDWSVKTEDQSKTLDFLFKVSQSTGIGIDSLADKVVQFGAPLRQFGFSFEEAAALMGKWEKEGVNLETIMGGMRAGLGKLAKAGEDPRKAFARLQTEIRGAGSVGEATAIAIETFGTRAGPDLAMAIREGRFELGDLVKTLGASGETILGASADTADFAEKWQMFKNRVLLVLEPIATRVFGAVGSGMEKLSAWWDAHGDEVVAGFGRVADVFKALGSAVESVVGWIVKNWDWLKYVVLGVLTILSPLLILLGAQFVTVGAMATASAARQVAAWTLARVEAVKSAAIMVARSWEVVGGWALMSAQALLHGLKVAAVWTAQIVASAVSGAASFAVQVGRVVAGWVLMGTQALLQAARLAAAWVLAMGPVGWVIAAVVGLVALIVANWDTVVAWTKAAWGAVTGAIGAAWEWIKGAVSAALQWVVNLFLNWTLLGFIIRHWDQIKRAFSDGVDGAIDFVRSLPGRAVSALGDLGGLLWNAGKSMIQGLINGAGSLLRNIGSFFLNLVPGWIRGPFEKALGIHSPSRVFAAYGQNIGQGLINGMAGMERLVSSQMLRLADTAAFDGMTATVSADLVRTASGPGAPGGPGSSALTRQDAPGAAGGDSYVVNVNVPGTKASPREVGDEVVWALKTSGR